MAVAGEPVDGLLGELDGDALRVQPTTRLLQQQVGDAPQLLVGELTEHDDLVDAVEELGPEVLPQRTQGPLAPVLLGRLGAARREAEPRPAPDDGLRAQVAGHDDDRVREVDRAALGVGEPAVVEDLQQGVEDIGMGLLHFVQQQQRVRMPSYGLRQLAGLLVADVAGRGADQPADRVPLLVLAHVEPHHPVLAAEEGLRQRAGQFGLADAGRAQEEEAADRPVGAGESGA